MLRGGLFGACALVARLRRSPPPACVILSYHSHEVRSQWGVPVGTFERQIAFLSTRFRVVRLNDLPDRIDASTEPLACVTFDDGYADNYELSLPILERFGVKATFFLVSSRLGGSLRTSFGRERLMSISQARDIASVGHEIGSHTVTHATLTELPPGMARREIVDSKRAIEDLLSMPVASLAYPKGRSTGTIRMMARDAGYELAVTTAEGVLSPDPDWFALPRISVNRSVGMVQFRAKASGALDVYRWLRRRGGGHRPSSVSDVLGSDPSR